MAETNATILIPDISGFTEFVTKTELDHGSDVITYLLNAIVEAVGDTFEISEIEGDAVLMFKRGPAPTKKEMLDTCMKIFEAFHFQRYWLQSHAICPCNACSAILNLTLKFVAHHGPVGEMKIGRFVTLSGTDVIVAHRLLKNSVPSNEYLLMTEKLCSNQPDAHEPLELEWSSLSDEFGSIGKVDYRFARLDEARKKISIPVPPENNYTADDTPYFELEIAAYFLDVYMVATHIPERPGWFPCLIKVEQDIPKAFVGSVHQCAFENYSAIVSPLKMNRTENEIVYAESFNMTGTDISLIYEFIFRNEGIKNSTFACRILNAGSAPVPMKTSTMLLEQMKQMAESLKKYCEAMEKSFFF